MAPKRKRSERQYSGDDASNRPSPHRPENLNLAQQNQRDGGSRGGRGGSGRRQSRQGAPSTAATADSPQVNSTTTGSPVPPARRETPTVDNSRAATPSQPMPPSQPPAVEGPKAPPAPYFYEHVTDDRVNAWESEGRQAIVEALQQADEMETSIMLQELIRSALDQKLDAAEAGSVIKQTIADRPEMDVQTLFLNTLALLDDADTKNSNLLPLVAATDIDPEVIRQELDIPLLQALSLVRSTFLSMRTRKTTNILYRQANFNLLREESEGYAKLITEYFNTASRAVHDRDVSAEAAFERITALVGSFDLDVGRVLDITLDISANLLVRAYGFFVKFYRCSFWWPESGVIDNVRWEEQGFGTFPKWALPESDRPKLDPAAEEERAKAEREEMEILKLQRDTEFWKRVADEKVGTDAFFELGARRIVNYDDVLSVLDTEIPAEYDARNREINGDRRKRINENRKYMKETKLLPPPGNPDAAQLLGFKLRFYASDARSANDVLPDNLIYLAALLIKIGFISLRDLYPHLYLEDEKMPAEKARLKEEKAEKERKERPGGGENALTKAGSLTDDTAPLPPRSRLAAEKDRSGGATPKPNAKDEEAKEELPTPTNQKLLLLKALLLIGCLPEAMYILGRFPWLVQVDASLPPYLHRVALQMLSKVAQTVRPLADRDTSNARPALKETAVDADGTVRFTHRETKKPIKWLGLDQTDEKEGFIKRHYYPDWDDNIPVCQDIEDVFTLCHTFLGFLGVKIGQDAKLLGTLVRIAMASLKLDFSEYNKSRWLDLMQRLLVPALSLSRHNPGLTAEVFELLQLFPTVTRYNIYANWFLDSGSIYKWDDIRAAMAHNRAEVKDVLRRVTNDNAKQHARALAKVSYSNPGLVVLDMIKLLEQYSNMIPALVECCRFFSNFGYDVLTWALIQSLGGPGLSRVQADGMLTSPWLQALAQFTASLFNRYTDRINPSPVLQYLASELRGGNTTDLEVFEQVLAEMGGIRSDLEFNDTQVLTMAGGEHLQAQMLSLLADKRFSRKTQAQKLIKALAEPGLIGQMLIAIAQERQMYPYHQSSDAMPLKVLGNNLDKIQQVFAQYLDVLKTNLKPEEFEATVPDLFSLIADFGLEPRIAFMICRLTILHRMHEYDATHKTKKRDSQGAQDASEDVKMEGEAVKPLTNGDHINGDSEEAVKDAATTPAADVSDAGSPPQISSANAVQPDRNWHPVLEPLIRQLPEAVPDLADKVSVPFYTTFWTYSLHEVCDTTALYQKEFDKITLQLDRIGKDRADMSSVAIKERDRKKKALLELNDNLRKEISAHVAVLVKLKKRVSAEKKHYFPSLDDAAALDEMHVHLLEECFLPRALLSSTDALYSFRMLKMLHDFGTPGFNTVNLLSQLMRKNRLSALMFQCTAMEAQHFGRFLCEILKLLQTWHASKATYEKEAHGASKQLPGFQRPLNKPKPDFIDYETFRRLVFKWHQQLTFALEACFGSGEYMHIRNGIILLRAVVQVFPGVNFMGDSLVKHVTKLSTEEERQDLKLAAMSLLGPLKNREKQWLKPPEFRLNQVDSSKPSGKPGSRAASETPKPDSAAMKLSATATEFKPGQAALQNGTRKESIAGVEDGEIEDEKQVGGKGGDEVMKDAPPAKADTSKDAAEEREAKSKSQESDKAEAKDGDKVGSKPSTPAPVLSRPPPTDSSRASSSQQAAPSRSGHGLPSRPDSRPPNRPLPTPPTERQGARYAGRGEDKYGRLDRPNDLRPASRDHSPGRRPRTPERDPYYSSFAAVRGGPPPRDERGPARPPGPPDSRYSRDDAYRRDHPSSQPPHSRSAYDSRERPNGPMGPPPPSQVAHSDRSSYPGAVSQQSSRAAASTSQAPQTSQSQEQAHVNPARRAMIENETTTGRGGGGGLVGPPKDTRRERDGRDERPPPSDSRAAAEPPRDPHARNAPATDLAPNGPRRGRLSRDVTAQGAESSFGRLNGPQDVPSGPRPPPNGPASRGGRGFQPPQAPAASRPSDSSLPSPSTVRPPESPVAPRGPNSRAANDRRGSGQQFERQTSSTSVPTTPATENGPAVHPSRLANVGAQPPPIQTNLTANGPGSAASPTSAAPSGPRGPGRAPAGPAAGSPVVPPSGPASAVERQRRGERQRADINATLQGANPPAANGQGVNFRGAAQNRTPAAPTAPTANAQPVQALASSMEPPARRNEPPAGRQEPPANRPASRGELIQGKQDRGDEGRRRDDGRQDRASGSRRSSRERRGDDEPPQRPPPQGMDDRRGDRRSGVRDERGRDGYEAPPVRGGERPFRPEDGPPRRPPPPESAGSYQGPASDYDRRGPRRDGPDDGRRGGRGGGRAEDFRGPPPRREEERRDGGRLPPPRDEGPPQAAGRKRRHEDGPAPPYDETKRRRSGR